MSAAASVLQPQQNYAVTSFHKKRRLKTKNYLAGKKKVCKNVINFQAKKINNTQGVLRKKTLAQELFTFALGGWSVCVDSINPLLYLSK